MLNVTLVSPVDELVSASISRYVSETSAQRISISSIDDAFSIASAVPYYLLFHFPYLCMTLMPSISSYIRLDGY